MRGRGLHLAGAQADARQQVTSGTLAEVEDRELKVALKKGLYVSMEEVSLEWTKVAGRVTSLLRNKFENELPPILSGLDATGIQEENRKAIDEVLTLLSQGHG